MGTYRTLYDYVDYLRNFDNESIELSKDDLNILVRFTIIKYTSAYQLYKALKSRGRVIAYKNVRKKILRFKSLRLIDISKQSKKHNAIYFGLTSFGIFHLYYKRQLGIWLSHLIENYGNDPIFYHLLYPILKRETVGQITSPYGYAEVNKYLAECCKRIGEILREALNINNFTSESHIFFWDDIPDGDNEDLLFYLLTRYGLEWLENGCRVQKN